MVQKKKNKSFLTQLFSIFSKKETIKEKEETPIATPDSFPEELKKARIKFKNFHLTKSLPIGEEIQRKDYKVKKNSDTLYKLEGKNFQIVLVTGDSLQKNEEKITGVLRITEAELNRALQREHSGLDSFLELWKPNVPGKKSGKHWKRILDWDRIWKEQVLLRLRPDTTALLLVSLDEDFERFVFQIATQKQKKIFHDELFYLNQGKNSPDWNPYSKNKSLVEPDLAMEEFLRVIDMIEIKIEKEEK